MPYALGAVQVQAGQTYTIPVGSAGTVGAVVCANESPYAVNASISATGAPGQWIVAQTADLIACDVSGFNGTLTFTTDNYLSNAASAPSFLLYLTAFAPGEPIRGTYPAPLMRLASGITTAVESPATTIEQDLLTAFVLSGLTPTKDVSIANQLDVSAGIAYPRQSDGSLLRQALAAATFLTSIHSTTYYLDLNPDGSWSWGTSHSAQSNYLAIAQALTDASGNISTVTNKQTTATTLLNGSLGPIQMPFSLNIGGTFAFGGGNVNLGNLNQAQMQLVAGFGVEYQTPGAGAAALGHLFRSWDGTNAWLPFSVGGQVLGALSWIDNAGVLHAPAPVTLAAGNQETGAAIVGGTDAAGAFRLNGVNFKTTLTTPPSSITLTVTSSTNIASVGAQDISKYGFAVQYQATAAAFSLWNGIYTTVGNCLMDVDAAAQTLDHHCDVCGHVSLGVPFTRLTIQRPDPTSMRGLSLGYACSNCGALEAFNLALTAADEADTTPQGSGDYATTRGAQATLIRQVMTALGLEVAP